MIELNRNSSDMDIWKYYGITHRGHLVCNPTSEAKLDELVGLLPLTSGARVLDIACGKAELLLRIAERHGCSGLGVDISPYEVEEAKHRTKERNLQDKVEVVLGNGAEYAFEPHSFNFAMCIGATWVWNGYAGTIEALKKAVIPGGLIAIGEPFKTKEPPPEHAASGPGFVPGLVTHAGNVAIALEHGLTPLYSIVSNTDDWDRYEGLQWLAAEQYATEHPEDPDVPELLERTRKGRDTFLNHGRDTLNWAIYLFRAPV
jgi:SAM-dependent methyltransferase